jgi:ribonuclease E
MSKKMLVNATQPEENRVAIVEDGILTELDIEVVGREQTRGNIYKATVVRVESGLQAAFVDYGGLRLGFLQMGEIHPDLFKAADPNEERKGRLRINDVLRRGQEILVQVVKGERGNKGAALTTFLSLAGRYMVLMPESDSTGVSRKIEEDSVRKKLKATMNSLDLPKNMGYIVRTAGVDQTKEELKRDFDYLVRVYENILALSKKAKAPALIYKESNLVIRSIRDYFTPDIDEVLVDDPKVAQEAKDFLQQVMPECVKLVKLHQEKRPIFSRYQIEEQIEIISRNKVLLPSGGSIVIDRTEALVAIDVNSGKMAGEHGVEATAYKTNLEAATEIGRQLRLRDLGGLVVIDFIDMRERKNNRDVEKAIKDSMKTDKAKVSFGKISSFGLLEMSRQRIKDALAEGTFLICPHCEGSGRLKSPEAQAVAALRKIQGGIAKGHIARIEVDIPLDAANYLLNAMRDELFELEQRNLLEIMVRGRADMIASQIEIVCIRREKEDELYLQPVTASNDEEQAPLTAVVPAENPVEEATVAEAPEKKKRGGRGRKTRIEETEAVVEEIKSEVIGISAELSESPVEQEQVEAFDTAETTEIDGAKKKRKRRRKKKKSVSTESAHEALLFAEQGITSEEDDEEGEGSDDELTAATTEESGEIPAKKKRRRKRKKKTAAGSEEVNALLPVPTTEAEISEISEPSETGAEAEAKKKRKRRRKKRSPAIVDEAIMTESDGTMPTPPATVAAAVIAAPAQSTGNNEEVKTQRKPARRPRQPKAPAEIAAELPMTLMVDAPPEEKPRKKRAPAKTVVKEAAPEAMLEVPEVIAAVPVPAKAKAPRVSKPRKVETVQEITPPVVATESAIPKKPRTARKKKSNDSEDAPATGE